MFWFSYLGMLVRYKLFALQLLLRMQLLQIEQGLWLVAVSLVFLRRKISYKLSKSCIHPKNSELHGRNDDEFISWCILDIRNMQINRCNDKNIRLHLLGLQTSHVLSQFSFIHLLPLHRSFHLLQIAMKTMLSAHSKA